MGQAGQHRLPGGQDAEGPGVLGLGGRSGPRFESEVTLQVNTFILYCKETTWKNVGESPPLTGNSSGKVPPRGARVGVGGDFSVFRGKFAFFGQFSEKVEKPPPPRLEPATSPSFA